MQLLNDEYLQEIGVSLSELSRKSGVPYSTLIKYFHLIDPRGIPAPLLPNARKIASALNVPLEELRFLGE